VAAEKTKNYYEILIVGAGPAGIASAIELIELGIDGSKILILDLGPDISERVKSRKSGIDQFNTSGLGGAGLFSDGKLYVVPEKQNLFPLDPEVLRLWEVLPNPHLTDEEARDIYTYAYNFFEGLNIPIRRGAVNKEQIDQMHDLFFQLGVYFEYYESRQIEPSYLPQAISKLKERLQFGNVKLQLNTAVLDISFNENDATKSLKCKSGKEDITFSCKFLILATGKMGMKWIMKQADNLGIDISSRPIQIGVRVEVPNRVLAPFTKVHRDLQLIRKINRDTLVQTFCTCSGGTVSSCRYGDSLVLGGYTDSKESPNTNFALLVKMDLGKVDHLEYGFSIIKATNTIGQGKPILQRLGDLKKGIASNLLDIQNNSVTTTLEDYSASNISYAFPKFIIDSLLETLDVFNEAIPGINEDSNLVSGPCLEFCYSKILLSKNMETSKIGIYVAGDSTGYESGLVPAVASGVLAARGILTCLNS
jgi:hypothetical protein